MKETKYTLRQGIIFKYRLIGRNETGLTWEVSLPGSENIGEFGRITQTGKKLLYIPTQTYPSSLTFDGVNCLAEFMGLVNVEQG